MNSLSQIIEVIGPAGSGKSTLAKALTQNKKISLAGPAPYFRNLIEFPFFVRNTFDMLPLLYKFLFIKGLEGPSLRDIAWMVTLKGWHRVLLHNAEENSDLLLDEGPVFLMAYLQIYGAKALNSPSNQAWWDQMYKQWSRVLNIIIYLDAPDETLIERIRFREKPHGVKVKPDDYAYKYLADLREKYEYLLIRLTSEDKTLQVHRFDTHQIPITKVCSEILAALK
jgi:shikimate kinase